MLPCVPYWLHSHRMHAQLLPPAWAALTNMIVREGAVESGQMINRSRTTPGKWWRRTVSMKPGNCMHPSPFGRIDYHVKSSTLLFLLIRRHHTTIQRVWQCSVAGLGGNNVWRYVKVDAVQVYPFIDFGHHKKSALHHSDYLSLKQVFLVMWSRQLVMACTLSSKNACQAPHYCGGSNRLHILVKIVVKVVIVGRRHIIGSVAANGQCVGRVKYVGRLGRCCCHGREGKQGRNMWMWDSG